METSEVFWRYLLHFFLSCKAYPRSVPREPTVLRVRPSMVVCTCTYQTCRPSLPCLYLIFCLGSCPLQALHPFMHSIHSCTPFIHALHSRFLIRALHLFVLSCISQASFIYSCAAFMLHLFIRLLHTFIFMRYICLLLYVSARLYSFMRLIVPPFLCISHAATQPRACLTSLSPRHVSRRAHSPRFRRYEQIGIRHPTGPYGHSLV